MVKQKKKGSTTMSLHIAVDNKAPVAKTVLMPGDPLRAQFIAENFLTDPVRYSEIRNMYGYTGTYKGVPVSVQGSGMGMPSMGIYSWELFSQHNVENIIRVGTAGGFTKDVGVGEIVVSLAASTDSNYQHIFDLNGSYSPSCSYKLLQKMMEAGAETGIKFTAGNTFSSDCFYEVEDDWWKKWASLGVLAVEMEAAALYMNAAYHHKNALAIMTISDHFVTGEATSPEEREKTFTDMMELALETAVKL
jgi:purine-nucleoside phosphorylase